ncbi:MAG: divalent-cation tolerance protein CutA [Opitutales bacterium]|nr:divalent-cation tolerance protein CutA [Opitutales bacterium]
MFIAWTTVDSAETAALLARRAVDAGVAACVQVDGPVRSFYKWQGKAETGDEWRLVFKVAGEGIESLEIWLKANHPYETPQWLACRADRVDAAYALWVKGGPVP